MPCLTILTSIIIGAVLSVAVETEEPCVGVPAITVHEISMVVAANRFRVQECYRQAVGKKPKLAGKLTARFKLTDQGSEVQIAESTLDDKHFEECVLGALRKFRFPPLRYRIGQIVKVNYPFSFRPENPDGKPEPVQVHYPAGGSLKAERDGQSLTVTLPAKAREALLAANPGYRLFQNGDFRSSDLGLNPPYPFAAVANFDRSQGNDLAIALIHKEQPGRWRLVALHHQPEGYRSVPVTDFDKVESHFRQKSDRRPAFHVTADARCFCDHQCLAIASNIGKSFEFEWNGQSYIGALENYLPPDDR